MSERGTTTLRRPFHGASAVNRGKSATYIRSLKSKLSRLSLKRRLPSECDPPTPVNSTPPKTTKEWKDIPTVPSSPPLVRRRTFTIRRRNTGSPSAATQSAQRAGALVLVTFMFLFLTLSNVIVKVLRKGKPRKILTGFKRANGSPRRFPNFGRPKMTSARRPSRRRTRSEGSLMRNRSSSSLD